MTEGQGDMELDISQPTAAEDDDVTQASGGVDDNHMHDELLSTQQQQQKKYDDVRNYCLGRSQVDLIDAMTSFADIPTAALEQIFQGLVAEGALQVSGQVSHGRQARSLRVGSWQDKFR